MAQAWADRPFDALATPPLTLSLTGEEAHALRRLLVEEHWPADGRQAVRLNNIYLAIFDARAQTLDGLLPETYNDGYGE